MKKLLNYCVWFPKFVESVKFFRNKKQALHFLNQQKEEAYLNEKVGTIHEDTIAGVNAE